jgi:hypothetical protein
MGEHFLLPTNLRILVLSAGIILLLLAALADALKLLGRQTSAATRAVLRVLLGCVGAVLIAWAVLSLLPTPPAASASLALAPTDLVQSASALIAAKCPVPSAPTVPDAASASLAEMVAAGKAFKAYDAATVTYTQCVDASIDQVQHQAGPSAAEGDLHRLNEFGLTAHNTAIDQEQSLADKFNAQVRLYKSAHPQ